MGKSFGHLTSIDLYQCNPATIRDADKIRKYVTELCCLIGMKAFGGTEINWFGNEHVQGFSMVQLIETSLISGHFQESTNNAYIDIFSCAEYSAKKATDFTQRFFEAKKVKFNILLRK